MLIGQYNAVITEKGRLAIPARFRKEIGNKLVVARWLEGCLIGVTDDGFNTLLQNLLGKRELSSLPVREIERFIMGSAYEVELDSQGRFVIPPLLKKYANVNDKIVFIGLGTRFEIWSEAKWEDKQSQIQKEAGMMMDQLSQTI